MDRQTPIMDAVASVCASAKVRFCMPGHKGDSGFFGGEILTCDITELPGADNLLKPTGAILQSEKHHAEFIGAAAAYYTTGGSTAGVLAMLSLFRGKKVIFPRGVHLSAANAIHMFGIAPVFLSAPLSDYPPVVDAEDVKEALRVHKDAAAVYITYPNYFGLCCDIEEIAQIAHKAGAALLVDAAHAAHFAYSPMLPISPAHAGADIWTESAHKTLPAMNQCACLCVGKSTRVDPREAKNALSMIQTTSPSYVLLSSLDYAHAYMRDKGEQEVYRVSSLLRRFEEMVCALPGYACPEMAHESVAARDPLKSLIDVSGTGHTGLTIKAMLARDGIHVEAADMRHILLMLSPGNTAAHLDRLYETLRRTERIRGRNLFFSPYSMPSSTKYSQNARNWGNIEKLRLEHAPGRVSACAAGVYPPAETVVIRGQVISYEIAGYLIEAGRQGFELFGVEDASIYVYKERS